MKYTLILAAVLFMLSPGLNSQTLPPGYPDRSVDLDVLPGFQNPPAGYGQVPFYWWMGDTLTQERLLWQLDELTNKGISSLQVNYAHDDKGGLKWGLPFPSKPALFTEEWWDLFGWFMQEADKRGMSVSLSDYSLGVGQRSYVDDAINAYPEINGAELYHEIKTVPGDTTLVWELPDNYLSVTAFRQENKTIIPGSAVDLNDKINDGRLAWSAPRGNWQVICVYVIRKIPSLDPLHPNSGKVYIENFFRRFEDRFPGEAGKGLNFFFSDELDFGVHGFLWNDIFEQEFKERKGYPIRPELPSLFIDTGPRAVKIRLDYNDVLVSLSEEGFFAPLFEWQLERGMIYGCDHGGRGKDVFEFGDYIRTQKYNQGPGADQPFLLQDIVKNKVASSIAHLYDRPRTWLEGFHSSGWSTNSAELSEAIIGNYVMGHNLLSLHGLYYHTHGGWWEWAPPCNHFRMPYFQHIDPLMNAVERLSYLLSQGYHRADVSIMYPVEPMAANMDGENSVKAAFELGIYLYNKGIDFDFMDYESLARANVVNNELQVSGERYRVLVLPSMKAIRFSTVQKALEFFRSGGIVVNYGALPQASERIGSNDKKLDAIILEMFGESAGDSDPTEKIRISRNNGKALHALEYYEVEAIINNSFPRDFVVLSDPSEEIQPRVMHREIGYRNIYAVYNVDKGTDCFFRSKGSVELWDPYTGENHPLYHVKQTDDGTIVTLPLERNKIQLIVFNPETNTASVDSTNLKEVLAIEQHNDTFILTGVAKSAGEKYAVINTPSAAIVLKGQADEPLPSLMLDGEWDFEIKPVLNNRWGDYHWPPTNELIGPEIRRTKYTDENDRTQNQRKIDFDDSGWEIVSNGYGPSFYKLGPLPDAAYFNKIGNTITRIDPADNVILNGKTYSWQPYNFSWRYGVENDPGHQGYHGLKKQMYDGFIRLGKREYSWVSTFYTEEEAGTDYALYTNVFAPRAGSYELLTGDVKPAAFWLNGNLHNPETKLVDLNAGNNTLLIHYDQPCTTYFIIKQPGDRRNHKLTGEGSLAMRWYGDKSILPFDIRFDEEKPAGWYRFESAPGLKRLDFAAFGKEVKIWIDEKEYDVQKGSVRLDGSCNYSVELGDVIARPATVAMRIEQEKGRYAGAALPEPIKMTCEKGIFFTGDWSYNDGLYAYSGGARYSRTISLNEMQIKSRVMLDLGNVISSAEVVVNDKTAGIKLAPPFRFDISELVNEGENRIDIMVYNTVANHYTSIPTRYRESVESGIIGPVKLEFMNIIKLGNE
jgi:hypothetical protein